MAAIGAVLIAFLLVTIVRSFGGDDAPAATQPTADASASPTPDATSSSTPSEAAAPADGATQVALTASATACNPQQIRLTPTVPADQLAGGDVRIELAVSSTSAKPCTLTGDVAELLVVISQDTNTVYDSTVCSTSLIATPVQVMPRWITRTTITWTGRAGCRGSEAFVGGGQYTLKLGTLGGEPGSATFTLGDPPPPPAPEPVPAPVPDPAAPVAPAPDPATPQA